MTENSNNPRVVPPPTPTVRSPPKPTAASRVQMLSQPGFSTSTRSRRLVHSSQHIDDLGRKHSLTIPPKRDLQFDECSLQMMTDPNSVIYRRLSESLGQRPPSATPRPTDNEEKLKFFEPYGPDLLAFVKDKDGNLKPKYDKVFII